MPLSEETESTEIEADHEPSPKLPQLSFTKEKVVQHYNFVISLLFTLNFSKQCLKNYNTFH